MRDRSRFGVCNGPESAAHHYMLCRARDTRFGRSMPRVRRVDEFVGVGLGEIDLGGLYVRIERLQYLVGSLGGVLQEAAVGRIGVVVGLDRLDEQRLVAQ